jgi:hypothetical protein
MKEYTIEETIAGGKYPDPGDLRSKAMSRRTIWWATLVMAVALSLFSQAALAQSQTAVAGAGAGVFPAGAAYNGVSLSTLRFGMGVPIAADGTAAGDFESTLIGTSAAGQPQTITVVGKPTSGSFPAAGTATFSGLCSVNMGDGSPALSAVPFTATAVSGVRAKQTLTLLLGPTSLPTATGTDGRITVK